MKFKNKQNESMIEVRRVVIVVGSKQGHKKTFWNTENVPYLDLVGGQMYV